MSTFQTESGDWAPAIPLPTFLLWGYVRCHCGNKYSNQTAYRGHYALVHILERQP